MKTFIAIVEKCPETGVYVGYVPEFPAADIQADTLDELYYDLCEMFDMLMKGNDSLLESQFIGMQTVTVA